MRIALLQGTCLVSMVLAIPSCTVNPSKRSPEITSSV